MTVFLELLVCKICFTLWIKGGSIILIVMCNPLLTFYFISKKVQVGKDQEKAQSEIPTPKTEVEKNQTNNQALIP